MSIKEDMEKRFGVETIPRKKVHAEEKITCEFKCSGCGEVIQEQGRDLEAAREKVVQHKMYDPTAQCEGVFTYSKQVFPDPETAPIPEEMEKSFGVGTIPRTKVPAEEMKRLIAESKVQIRAKKGKSTEDQKTEWAKDTEKGCMDNYPCPKCKEVKWMKVPDDSSRYYCLICGGVIQYPGTEAKDTKKITWQHDIPAPVPQCDEAETGVGQMNPFNEPITETGNEGRVFCEYRCFDCQDIVVACGRSLNKAKELVASHKNCGGRLIYVRQISPRIADNKERFSHPKAEKAICSDCFYDMGCPRTFKRIIACLFRDIGYNIKKTRSD